MIRAVLLFVFLTPFLCTSVPGGEVTEKQFVYDSHGTRDPFVPLLSNDGKYLSDTNSSDGVAQVNLSGIIWSKEGPSYAILNGDVAAVDDRLGRLVVEKIESNSVLLRDGDKKYELILDNSKGGNENDKGDMLSRQDSAD
jgi:hypothetical protein